MKKTILKVITAAMAASLILCSCGAEKTPTPADTTSKTASTVGTESTVKSDSALPAELDYANLTEEDLLGYIKDQANPTLEEYLWLVDTYRYVEYGEDLTMPYDNITRSAIATLRENAENLPSMDDIIDSAIASEYPQVVGYALDNMFSLFGVSDTNLQRALTVLGEDQEPYVLAKAMDALSNECASDPAIYDFAKKMVKHENKYVRKKAAGALSNPWSVKCEGIVDVVLDVIATETDEDVRGIAIKNCGRLESEEFIAPLVAILDDASQEKLHDECVDGLNYLWYDYPFHESTSKAAYDAVMAYLSKTPRTEDVPSWLAVGSFDHKSDNSFEEWKAKADYYDPAQIVSIMTDIVKDPDADWLARSSAIKTIKAHGTDQDMKDLGKVIEGLTDSDANNLQNSYNNEVKDD